eukprot:TRINITY_DN13705_c0_g1_i1.p1 TRINITY_DN13705_c0_g1~~TRINITY_DN13705_c0_g1_i1.p1  ORF type:complete len:477 (+),score=89.99 TRINITY_DN13705_c0_g1_i1:88-1518(+)
MKFGDYLANISASFDPLISSDCFVRYNSLKEQIACEDDASFYESWEDELVRVSRVAKSLSENDSLTTEQREAVMNFQQLNREALRKLAKKSDKRRSENPPQQQFRLRMVDCAFAVASQPQSIVQPEIIGVALKKEMDTVARAAETTPTNSLWDKISVFANVRSAAPNISILIFVAVVVFQPILADVTKGGSDRIPYIESSVICVEAILSCCIGFSISSQRKLALKDFRYLLYSPSGLLKAFGDTAEIVSINYVDPSMYATLSQSRLVLTGVLAYFFLSKKPNKNQWQAMGLITSVLVAFPLARAGTLSGGGGLFGFFVVGVAVVCKVAAAVYQDKVLKGDDVCLVLQSALISSGTILPSIVYAFVFDFKRLVSNPFVGWSWQTALLVVLLLCKNWLSNITVKRFSAVMKYVIYAVAGAGTYIMQCVIYQEPPTVLALILVSILVQGAYSYADGGNRSNTPPVSVANEALEQSMQRV